MKKVALILAIALVFIFGGTTVLKHKIWAKGEKGKKIVLWIPINIDGKADLDMIKKGDFDFKEDGKSDPPIPVKDWKLIHNITNITAILHENNPFCFTVWSEGAWITR